MIVEEGTQVVTTIAVITTKADTVPRGTRGTITRKRRRARHLMDRPGRLYYDVTFRDGTVADLLLPEDFRIVSPLILLAEIAK